jgi:Tol biopolymer transport system component
MAAAVALAVAVAVAIGAVPSRATYPGANGLLVYQASVGDHVQLFTVRPDGTHLRQLTDFTDSDAGFGSWSADGSRIVFERDFADGTQLESMNANGGDLRVLTPLGWQFEPTFSPNGNEIVFERFDPATGRDGVWIMNRHGNGLRQVTSNPPAGPGQCLCDETPVFSPDGKTIAFVRVVDDQTTAVFVVDRNGHHLRQVTPWSLGVSEKLDWAPDGSRLLVSSPPPDRPNVASNVISVRPDGTGLTYLTHDATPGVRNLADAFSPDGTKIVFARSDASAGPQLWLMNADGSNPTQITHGVDAHWANWGTHVPTGSRD